MEKISLGQNVGLFIGGIKVGSAKDVSILSTAKKYEPNFENSAKALFDFAEVTKKATVKIGNFSFNGTIIFTNKVICKSGAVVYVNTKSKIIKKVIKKFAIKAKQNSKYEIIKISTSVIPNWN